jgi:recombination protein RecT
MTAERMTRLAISAIRTTRDLDKCSLVSFAGCLMACSTLGLEPNTPLGHAYLIPRWNSRAGGHDCTLIVGYKGLIDLMFRSGLVSSVKADPVFQGDTFVYKKGLNPVLDHTPCGEDEPSKLTHVYTIVEWRDSGKPIWDVLTRRQVEKRRDRGGYDPKKMSPWKTDFTAMAQKTGVRDIARWAPTATERTILTSAVSYEEAAERGLQAQAVMALGEKPAEILDNIGAFPTNEPMDAEFAEVNEDGEVSREIGADDR